MNISNFISELKRRNVIRVAIAYVIASWLIIQVVTVIEEPLAMPGWFDTVVIVLVGIGFPLSLIIAWAFELTPEGLKNTREVDQSESITEHTGKKINKLIIGSLSLLVILLLTERVFFADAGILDFNEAVVENASIAVLPFVNMSSDRENEYFSDGLSEELLNSLAKVEEMKVAGRTSSFKFKGQNENLTEIGRELGVKHILEGSVRKSGNRVRVTAQLIKVDDGYHIWSETYDRELEDIFEVQEEIARKVLSELRVRLIPEDESELRAIPTSDIEAYQMFLKANQLVAGRDIDDINVAIDLYKNAIAVDPGFSQAYARLAIAYNLQGYYGNVSFDTYQKNLIDNAEKALSMNEHSDLAYAALGLYYGNTSELEKSKEALLRSIELNPNNANVYNWLAITYDDMGDQEKRNEMYRKMYEVDPLSPLSIYNLALVNFYTREYEKAEALLKKNMQLNPGFALSYSGYSIMKGDIPFGRLDESFRYARTAMKYGRVSRAMVWTVVRAIDLDLEGVADYYFMRLRNEYGESMEYLSIIPYYSLYKGDYTYMEKDLFPHFDETNTVNQNSGYYFSLAGYVQDTGNEDRAISEFKKFDAQLFEEEVPPLTFRNYEEAYNLMRIYGIIGDRASQSKMLKAYCSAAEALKSRFPWKEEDPAYLQARANCFIAREDYAEALPLVEELFIKQNRRLAAWYYFEEQLPEEVYAIDGYTQIRNEIKTDLERQRENVVSYLKEQGEWQEAWELSTDK